MTTIEAAADAPLRFHQVDQGRRRANLKRFPYHFLYREIEIWIFPKARLTVYSSKLDGSEHMKYPVVIEKSETGFGAYVPDLPGCVAVGETLSEIEGLIREAIEFHLDGLREDGLGIPDPSTVAQYVEV